MIARTVENESMVAEELAYLERTWGDARESSLARLRKWAARAPWIGELAAARGVTL